MISLKLCERTLVSVRVAEEFLVDITKVSPWATIGSFLVGCIMLYLKWREKYPPEPAGAVTVPPVSVNVSMWMFLLVLLVAGVLNAYASFIASRHHVGLRGPIAPASTSKINEQRIFVGPDITPEFLMSQFDGHTDFEGSALVEPYIGTWIKLSGPVHNIGNGILGYQIEFPHEAFGRGFVIASFDEKWAERLRMLRQGSMVSVVGSIKSVGKSALFLFESELVS